MTFESSYIGPNARDRNAWLNVENFLFNIVTRSWEESFLPGFSIRPCNWAQRDLLNVCLREKQQMLRSSKSLSRSRNSLHAIKTWILIKVFIRKSLCYVLYYRWIKITPSYPNISTFQQNVLYVCHTYYLPMRATYIPWFDYNNYRWIVTTSYEEPNWEIFFSNNGV